MKMLDHWLPPEDAGDPLACLATSFTFDTDFFAEDCLSRFLAISGRDPDGAFGSDIAGLLDKFAHRSWKGNTRPTDRSDRC